MMIVSTSAVSMASPVADCSLGQVSAGLNFSAPSLSASSGDSDGNLRVGYDVAAGLGLGFSGQYTFDDFKMKNSLNGSDEIKAQQLFLVDNVLDLVAKVSLFGGISQTQIIGGSEHRGFVAGIAGNIPVAPNMKAYAVYTAGNHVGGYELGLSYQLAKDTEFNLGYRDTKYKGLTYSDGSSDDIKVKGLIGGISYKL
ncbi:outer membrane beta-barrel protein [Lucifera butyrica]|nr:outer membrane beta-barrel protein [Lucifera butyrica]